MGQKKLKRRSSRRAGKQIARRMRPQLPPLKLKRGNVLSLEEIYDAETKELLGEVIELDNPEDAAAGLPRSKRRKEKVFRAASTLRRLRAKKDIGMREFDAGIRFNERYALANLAPNYKGSNFTFAPGSNYQERIAIFNDAAREVFYVLSHFGEMGQSILVNVVGQEMSLAEWVQFRARPNRWGWSMTQTIAKWILTSELNNLAQIYRMMDRRRGRN